MTIFLHTKEAKAEETSFGTEAATKPPEEHIGESKLN